MGQRKYPYHNGEDEILLIDIARSGYVIKDSPFFLQVDFFWGSIGQQFAGRMKIADAESEYHARNRRKCLEAFGIPTKEWRILYQDLYRRFSPRSWE